MCAQLRQVMRSPVHWWQSSWLMSPSRSCSARAVASSTALGIMLVALVFSMPPAPKLRTISWSYRAHGYFWPKTRSNSTIIRSVRSYVAFASSPRPFGAHTVIGTLLMVLGSCAWSKSPITSDTRYGTWRFSCTQCQTSRSPFTSCEASAPLELA